ncbi:uncharacterized protein LOC134092472 isoform X2 [Sardina pilchardus]|uniref:uncharacterized protein LOC134092472 isoform X2 n=1 Tax=Sardina pilchardus TaxID=27697 RepID=UPI002E0DD2CB
MRLKPNRGILFLCLMLPYIGQVCGISLGIVQKDELHREERSKDIHTGTITFGTGDISLGRNLEYESRYVGENPTNDGSVNIQADFSHPGLLGGQSKIDDYRAWSRMRPKLVCTNDLMKFSAQGPGCSSLQLYKGGKPLSLSQLPRDCGYSVKRTAVGLKFLAPLDGCDVVEQGNNHLLQLLWNGNPVTLSCPVSSSGQVSPVVSTTPATEAPLPPQNWWMPPIFGGFPPLMPVAPPPATEAPTTAAKLPPQNPWVHPIFGGFHPVMPVATVAPTTEAAEPPPQNQWMQPIFGGFHPVMPVATVAPTTEAAEPPPQNQWMQPIFGGFHPVAPATEAPTTAAKLPPQNPWVHPIFGGFHPVMPVATVAPTTEAAELPSKNQWVHPIFGGFHPVMPVAPATEAPTTAAKLPPQKQWVPVFGGNYGVPFGQ